MILKGVVESSAAALCVQYSCGGFWECVCALLWEVVREKYSDLIWDISFRWVAIYRTTVMTQSAASKHADTHRQSLAHGQVWALDRCTDMQRDLQITPVLSGYKAMRKRNTIRVSEACLCLVVFAILWWIVVMRKSFCIIKDWQICWFIFILEEIVPHFVSNMLVQH